MDSSWILSILQSFLTPYTLQSLSVCALIATVVINLIYSRKQYKEMQKQTEALQKQVEELQKKPDLKVELNPTLFESVHPYFNKNSKSLPVEFMNNERNVWYIKLDVCNKGKATAKECLAKVEIIEKEPPNRVMSSTLLTWDLNISNRTFIDIPVNDCEMAVLIKIIREYEEEQKPTRKPKSDSLYIGIIDNDDIEPFYTYSYNSYIRNEATQMYEKNMMLKITVYCENATSNPKYYAINLSKLNEVINSKKISELLEEIREIK